MRPTAETTTILDVGVTPRPDGGGFQLLREVVPLAGAGSRRRALRTPSELERVHPGLTFIQTDGGGRLPFEDRQFDIAFSTAVIEHVGDRNHQQGLFLSELLRVSKRFFLTTPNRRTRSNCTLHTSRSCTGFPSTTTSARFGTWARSGWRSAPRISTCSTHGRSKAVLPSDTTPHHRGVGLFGLRSNVIAFGN